MPVKNAQAKSPIIRNLTGGLNVREAITDIADNENIASTNLNYYTAGAVARRGGWVKLTANSPTALPLLGIYQAVFNNAGVFTSYLVVTDGVGIWTTTAPAAAPVVWTSILGGAVLDASQPYHFAMMGGKLIVYNGKVAYYWTGAGDLTAFALPTGTYYSLSVGDILLTAVTSGAGAAGITFAYTPGATAGAEVVTVTINAISVQIQNGVSTATQIITALRASAPATALVSATTLSGSNPQFVTSAPTATPVVAPYITVPLSRVGVVWQNFFFWGGDGNNPARLYFSSLADPTTYPQANFIDVPDPFGGDQITGLAILYGNLLVFKRYSFYILQGAPPGNLILSKLNSSVGCVEPASVVQIDNLVYFVSDKGLYAANLFNIQQKCYKVEPRYIAAVPASTAANPIWAAHYKQKSQIFIACNARTLYAAAGNYNDRILAHDYFNADQNGDPACSEFIVGYTAYSLSSAKPLTPTAPSIMGDFAYAAGTTKSVTVMSSFYDPFVYVFQDGALPFGGPPDNISWFSAPTYPPTDFLSKFFDMGDPDMLKQVRWLWTTGQIYNNLNLAAGIVYSNSPTAVSFVDFNTDIIELKSPNGTIWLIGVDDDGALDITLTTDTTFLTTVNLVDANGNVWQMTIANDGAISMAPTTGAPVTPPVLASVSGFQYQMSVDTDGAIMTTAAFAPNATPIVPGARVPVIPIVNGVVGTRAGKYFQLYFTGIGILSQFSMDVILKGRRN